jgi:hypothetical protein
MSWGLIPWSQLKHKKMTYLELLEQLQCCSKETLQQTVTLYSIKDDEFTPAYMTDYTDSEEQVLNRDHLVITY